MIGDPWNTTDTFNNPFEEINANVIDSKRIVEYWCNPFELGLLSNFDELKFRTSKIPIILQGSRGSGKTTILKYYSFPAQVERVDLFKEKSILKRVKTEGEIGFYYRCEESFVSTFITIFRATNPNDWTRYFECYIELVFSLKLIEMVFTLVDRNEIQSIPHESIRTIVSQAGIKNYESVSSLNDLYNLVHNAVLYFEQYKNRIIFQEEKFNPPLFLDMLALSTSIIQEMKRIIPEFKNVLFVLMIDEYENLNEDLQKRFNTIIKFIKPDVSIRIGRRSEGLFTTETVNDVEYLRENHDYYLATIGNEQNININRQYFLKVAEQRFRMAESLDDSIIKHDICSILGDREDLLEECKEVCGTQKKHLEAVLKQTRDLALNDSLRKKIIEIIQNNDNPIAETINALWVIRDKKKQYIETAQYAVAAMHNYFNGEEGLGVHKYKADYANKYRYAITVFICSVYKKNKLYYGFNALSHLSNGNVRTFLNFCQAVFNEAMFYEKSAFLKTGEISKKVQSNAIWGFARSEFNSICSVVYAGDQIRRFVLNLGTLFSLYHKDHKIRYPETTQFALDTSSLYQEDRNVLKTAESWAIIIKKQKVQRTSAGVNERTELYYLNKMFSPLFNISYRTRGGVNLIMDTEDVHFMLNLDSYIPERIKTVLEGQEDVPKGWNDDNQQLSFFD